MFRVHILGLALIMVGAFFSCGGFGGGCGPGVPEPDRCSNPPASARVDSVELGSGNPDSLFEPWVDEVVVPVTTGGQGSAMFPMRLRLRGAGVPACLPQKTVVTDVVGGTIAMESAPLKTYDQGDGIRLTRTLWLVVDGYGPLPDFATVETTVEGKTASRAIWIGAPYEGPDAVSISPIAQEIAVAEAASFVVTLSAPQQYADVSVGSSAWDVATVSVGDPDNDFGTVQIVVMGHAPGSADIRVGLGRSVVTARVTVVGPTPDAGP